MSGIAFRTYRVLGTPDGASTQSINSLEELTQLIAHHIRPNGSVSLQLTLREELDELSARRTLPAQFITKLIVDSIRFGPDGFVNAHTRAGIYVHIAESSHGLRVETSTSLYEAPSASARP